MDELWALLHFLNPAIFPSASLFQKEFSAFHEGMQEEEEDDDDDDDDDDNEEGENGEGEGKKKKKEATTEGQIEKVLYYISDKKICYICYLLFIIIIIQLIFFSSFTPP